MADNPENSNLSATVVYRRLLSTGFEHWQVFAVAAVAMVFFAASDTGFAFLIKTLTETIDNTQELTPQQEMIRTWLPLATLLLFVTRGFTGFVSAYAIGWIGRKTIQNLRQQVFEKCLYLPISFYDRNTGGELLSKVTYDIEQVAEAASNVVTVLIRDTLTIIGLIAFMVYLSPLLAGFIFLAAPVLVILLQFLARLFRKHSRRIQGSMGSVTHIAGEVLGAQRIIKIFNGEDYELNRFGDANEKNRRLHMRLIATKGAGNAVTVFVSAMAVAAVIYMITRIDMRLGDVNGFLAAMVLLMAPLKRLTNINATIQKGVAAGQSIFAVLDQPVEQTSGDRPIERATGLVDFRDVSFTYDEAKGEVLSHINLTAQPGEVIAIVGRSGSGKSTLVSLLPRFYDPTSGEIRLDDVPIGECDLGDLRRQISLVSQDVTLFNDTIANNIAYGSLNELSREEIVAATRAAHVDEFVAELPEGLETVVGDRGVLLSGGQRQRIAIARALLKDAPVLILDEATSALDTESERHIQQALNELMRNRTTFVIAHRLSTIENADRIVVMADGRIVETGSHADLLAANGQYAALHRLQFADS